MFIGDLIMTREQHDLLYTNKTFKRHGLKRSVDHWPDGVVPVMFDKNLPLAYKILTRLAMKHIMDLSCIKFETNFNLNDTTNYLHVVRSSICASELGNQDKGRQYLYISKSCKKGNIVHELLHTLGLLHMHQAVQRDNYVSVKY